MADRRTYEKELWDGMKKVYDRYEEGRKTAQDVAKFVTERARIEESYAKGLQGLCSKPLGTPEGGSLGAAWQAVKTDHETQQRLRTNLSQTITRDLVTDLLAFNKDMKKQKETLEIQVNALNKELERGSAAVKKAKDLYFKNSELAEAALLQYERAQQDPTHPPKTLTKLNTNSQKARKESETADTLYQQEVQNFQKFQLKFNESMKLLLSEFQNLEERRTERLSEVMVKLVDAQTALNTELQRSTQTAQEAVTSINGLQDVQDFIAENKTGLLPSKPTEYESYKWQHEHASIPASQKSRQSVTPASSGGAAIATKQPSSVATSGSAAISRSAGSTGAAKASSGSPALSASGNTAPAAAAASPASAGKKAKALYEYTASDDTEISFDVDEIIVVHKIDDSGWWEGESRGHRGIFPGNYVELLSPKRCRVKFEFTAENDDELTINVGDIITINSDTEGWFSGTNDKGQSGMFPANYVELL